MNQELFQFRALETEKGIWRGYLPDELSIDKVGFEALWDLHPEEYHTIRILGKDIKTPRWQQAYGKDYRYTGAKQNAQEISPLLQEYLVWCQQNIHPSLNGLLLNWYDGKKKHYIGAHRDDTRDLEEGSPIVTISLGEERVFRLRPYGGKSYQDFLVQSGSVLIIPWQTNLSWTHEVPHFARFRERRISITLRAFEN